MELVVFSWFADSVEVIYSDNAVTAELKPKDLSLSMCVMKSVMFPNTE